MSIFVRKIFTAAILCLALVLPSQLIAQDDGDGGSPEITLQTFYDQLAPYGQWVNYGNYGYVFIPSVAPGFEPYATNGHWVYNDQYGWMWSSDYPWGWATFHYGRWNYDASYGWFWIPDLNWGPAWVAWRNCDGYYGWAPLPWGVSIDVGFGGGYNIANEYWCFVPQDHLCEINLRSFFVPRIHNSAFIEHSALINNMDYDRDHHFGYFKGPDRAEVERYWHHPVTNVKVDDYRRIPARRTITNVPQQHDEHNNNDHRDMQQHNNNDNRNTQQHNNNDNRNMQQHNNNDNRNMQQHNNNEHRDMQQHNAPAPQRHVEINQVPRRGRR